MKCGREGGAGSRCGESFATTLEVGGQFVCARDDSMSVLDTGATANFVCFKWIQNHNTHKQKMGIPKVNSNPTAACFEIGDGRIGEARSAAEIKDGSAGRKGAFPASVLEADIPSLLRKGGLTALRGRLHFARDVNEHSEDTWSHRGLRVTQTGHYGLTVVSSNEGPSRVGRAPKLAAPYFEWAPMGTRHDLSNGC